MGAPLLPELSDWKTLIEKTAPFTDLYRFDRLNLNIPSRQRMLDFIDARYPHLLPLYSRIYTQEDPTYYQNLAQQIRTYCTARQLKSEIFFA
jgi:hypothetical protein